MRRSGRLLVLLCAALMAALLLAACGEDEEPAAPATSQEQGGVAAGEEPAPAEAASGPAEVEIADFKYLPEALRVSIGDEVTWTNADAAPHTATAEDESFDTGDLSRGDEGSVTFDEPGTYAYYCRFHAFMKATIEVEES